MLQLEVDHEALLDSYVEEEKQLHDKLKITQDEDQLLIIMSELQSHFEEGWIRHQKRLTKLKKQATEMGKSFSYNSKSHSKLEPYNKLKANINHKKTKTPTILFGIEMDSSEDLDSESDETVTSYGDDIMNQFNSYKKDSRANSITNESDNDSVKSGPQYNINKNNNNNNMLPLLNPLPNKSTKSLPDLNEPIIEEKDMDYVMSDDGGNKSNNNNNNNNGDKNSVNGDNNNIHSTRFDTPKSAKSFFDSKRNSIESTNSRHENAFRLEKFCDIKFVRNIFVRWISCDNEVLNHVTARSVAVLFSHEYLTPDEFLDLAELLLGVHEGIGAFSKVEVTHRKSRAGILFEAQINESSSSDEDDNNDDNNNNNIKHDNDGSSSTSSKSSSNNDKLTKPKDINTQTTKKDKDNDINKLPNAKTPQFATSNSSEISITSSSSTYSGNDNESSSYDNDYDDDGIEQLPFDIHWDNRLYSAMNILTLIVQNDSVNDQCIIALDEWIGLIVMDIFDRSNKAGFGVLEAFIQLIKATLFRFASKPEIMGESKLAQFMCSEPEALLNIITARNSTLVTRAIALELTPLLMVTSDLSEKFAQTCLVTILDDGRFNPFEPGDINMSRTFQRSADDGKLRNIDARNPLKRLQTVAAYVPNLLFQNTNNTFVDDESVMRLTFMAVIKAINTLSRKIIQLDEKKEDNKDKDNDINMKNGSNKKKKKKKDDEKQVDRLEGEFDASTARKIRNFFSRDAEYTRNRILELIGEEDDVLIDVLLELLLIETSLKRSKSRLAQRIRYLFDPLLLFYDFLEITQADHSFLLDLLISPETSFLDYLLRFCKRMTANWHPSRAKKQQVTHVMSILIRLRMSIRSLHQQKLFPWSPKVLLKVMEKMEFCYENNQGAYSNDAAWYDPNYIEKRKQELKERKMKEEKEKKLKEKKNRKKTKKIKINPLFVQDIEQQKKEEERKKEIEQKTAENLKKRDKRKSIQQRKMSEKQSNMTILDTVNEDDKTNYNKVNWKKNKKHKKHSKKKHKKHKKDKTKKDKTKIDKDPNKGSDSLAKIRKHRKGATNQFLQSHFSKNIQPKRALKITESTMSVAQQFAKRKLKKDVQNGKNNIENKNDQKNDQK